MELLVIFLFFIFVIVAGELSLFLISRPAAWFAITLIWQSKESFSPVNVLTICRQGYNIDIMKQKWLNWLKQQYTENEYHNHMVTVVEVK